VDFTREPIIESIITPREGFRIVVRSSKNVGHEEYFVDALEIIVFGGAVFFRSNEKPKPFLVPSCDYEIFEVREPRILLKTPSIEGTVKISSTKELLSKPSQKISQSLSTEAPSSRLSFPVQDEKEELHKEKGERAVTSVPLAENELPLSLEEPSSGNSEGQLDKKRDRRTRFRKRKGSREDKEETRDERKEEVSSSEKPNSFLSEPQEIVSEAQMKAELGRKEEIPPPVRNVLPPPTTLIRDDIERLRKDDTFKGAFFIKDDRSEETEDDDDDAPVVPKRLVFDEEESSENESIDDYKATPAKSSMKEVREPFWIPPSTLVPPEMKKPE